MKENLWEKFKKKFIRIFSGGLAILQLGIGATACAPKDPRDEPNDTPKTEWTVRRRRNRRRSRQME